MKWNLNPFPGSNRNFHRELNDLVVASEPAFLNSDASIYRHRFTMDFESEWAYLVDDQCVAEAWEKIELDSVGCRLGRKARGHHEREKQRKIPDPHK